MSRHGYREDIDSREAQWSCIRWAGALKKAIEGKRGQLFLKELLAALDALPEKRLVKGDLVTPQGEVCALGSVMVARGVDSKDIDPECWETVAGSLGITETLAREVMFQNDESIYYTNGSEEQRWTMVRNWVESKIKPGVP